MKQFRVYFYFCLHVLVVFIGIGVFPSRVQAATFYIDPYGNDANPGTQVAPFKSFTKAMASIGPGDTVYLNSGTYDTPLIISKSGTATQPILIRSTNGNATIDVKQKSNIAINITGSYITISHIIAANSGGIGIQVLGHNNTLDTITSTKSISHGIVIAGTDITIRNSTIHETVNENNPTSESNGWGSGLKIAQNAQRVLVEKNLVFHNYGEGIATTRGVDVTIRGNRVYDNFSANIYVDNSPNVIVERNFVTCGNDAAAQKFFRNGKPASGILMGEESYSGWGAQLKNITIQNNVVFGCRGISFYGAEVSPGGLKNAVIRYNTLWGINGTSAISIANEPQNSSISITNNIAPGTITTGENSTVSNTIQSPKFITNPISSSIDSFRLSPGTAGYGTHGYQFEDLDANSIHTTPIVLQYKQTDLDKNGVINIFDYNQLLSNYGKTGSIGGDSADFNHDGKIDIFDYNIFLIEFSSQK